MTSSDDGLSKYNWRMADGTLVSCYEKIKVLEQNLAEIEQICRDALDDARYMGCDTQQFHYHITSLLGTLRPIQSKSSSS